MTASILRYQDRPIRCEGDHVCLTDLWKAAQLDDTIKLTEAQQHTRRPSEWLRQDSTKILAAYLSDYLIADQDRFELSRTNKGGRDPSTWAHWQLALAYAKYLSPAFHVWCNTIVRGYMQGAAPATVFVQESRHQGFDSVLAACKTVGDNQLWCREIQQRIGYLAFSRGITFQKAHGALRKHLGVVSYKRTPASLLDETRRFFDSLASGALMLAARNEVVLHPGQLRMFAS